MAAEVDDGDLTRETSGWPSLRPLRLAQNEVRRRRS